MAIVVPANDRTDGEWRSVHPVRGSRVVTAVLTTESPTPFEPRSDRELLETARLAAVGDLAAGAAHEINNPLFAILGLVEFLLRDAEPGTKAHGRLELVQSSALEIKEVVRAVLDFARDRRDETAVVALDDTVREMVALVAKTTAGPGLEIELAFGAGPFLVVGRPAELKLAVLEPLLQVRRAHPDGTTVRVALTADAGHVVAAIAGTTLRLPRHVA